MRKIICLFLFAIGITKVEAQQAGDDILSKIVKAEIALKEKQQLNQGDLKEIILEFLFTHQKVKSKFGKIGLRKTKLK